MDSKTRIKIQTAAIFKYGLSIPATNAMVKYVDEYLAMGCPEGAYYALNLVYKDMALPARVKIKYAEVIRLEWAAAICTTAICVSRGWVDGRTILANLKRAFNNQYGRPGHTALQPYGPVYDA